MNLISVSLLLISLIGIHQLSAAGEVSALQLHKWSGEINIPDPVAVTVDPQGRVYVTQTTRRKVGDLDIREHVDWIEKDVSLSNIEEKRAFYRDILAPGKGFKARGSLQDHNKDGSVDWKDLTVHSEVIYRLEDKNGDGVADDIKVFADGFNTEVTGIAAGVLYHDGWIYATIAPDLWRLKDTDGDGKADIRESIVHGFGHHIAYAGHDMHGLAVGPDGRIYWTIGDKGTNVTTQEGKVVRAPHTGALLRCEPDGSNFEIFARGLRNVQEIAFDDFGNVIGVDNDADKPGEKERILYITEGSDSGWRCGYQYMTGYNPWMDEFLTVPQCQDQPAYITPALLSYHDGPAGFGFNPGTALGKGWENRFFSNQFPSGKMSSFRLNPKGAAFEVTEDLLVSRGVMGIGMSWHPDGSLFMADWMGGYPLDELGAVWRVDVPADKEHPKRKETLQLLQQNYAEVKIEELLGQLSYPDQRVRRGAQFELVKREAFDQLEEVALDEARDLLSRIHAIWGLGQGWRVNYYDFRKNLPLFLKEDAPPQIILQTIKMLADCPRRVDLDLSSQVLPFLQHSDSQVRFHAAIALGKLKVEDALGPLLQGIIENNGKDAFLRHAYSFGLAGASPDSVTLSNLHRHENIEVRLSAVLALRRQKSARIVEFLKDEVPSIRAEAARAIYDDQSIPGALDALAALVDDLDIYANEGLARRALGANFRMGDSRHLKALMKIALNDEIPLQLRKAALVWMDQWPKPKALDLVDGQYRKLEPRPIEKYRRVLDPKLDELLTIDLPELRAMAVGILANHELTVNPELVAAAVMDLGNAPELRAKTLSLLGKQAGKTKQLKKAVADILADVAPSLVHIEALEILFKENQEAFLAAAQKILKIGELPARQRAIKLLGELKNSQSLSFVKEEFLQFRAGNYENSRALELIETVGKRQAQSEELAEEWKSYQAEIATMVATPSKGEFAILLEGGDVTRGERIVKEHLAANCIACHRVSGNTGSQVGPALNDIGKKRDRQYLLQALVEPNAEVTLGFGVVNLTTKAGENIAGTLMEQNEKAVKVRLSDGGVKSFQRDQLSLLSPPISVMPPMGLMLSKTEIRDVVEYLSTLKPKAKK